MRIIHTITKPKIRVVPKEEYQAYYRENIITIFINKILKKDSVVSEKIAFEEAIILSGLLENGAKYSGKVCFENQTQNGSILHFFELKFTGQRNYNIKQFRGLLFVLEGSAQRTNPVYIFPNNLAEETDSSFEKKFIIKSSNKEEVEQLRHSELMQSMDELNKKWGTKIRISFVANKIYLLLPTPSKYFKTNLLKTVYDNDLARQLYAELTACFAIIQLLNQHH